MILNCIRDWSSVLGTIDKGICVQDKERRMREGERRSIPWCMYYHSKKHLHKSPRSIQEYCAGRCCVILLNSNSFSLLLSFFTHQKQIHSLVFSWNVFANSITQILLFLFASMLLWIRCWMKCKWSNHDKSRFKYLRFNLSNNSKTFIHTKLFWSSFIQSMWIVNKKESKQSW